jgi:predicted CoA-binding protein
VTSSDEWELISEFGDRRIWAVVGVSHDRSKFGYFVFRNLSDAGYTVYPINPKGGELQGSQVYPSLADLPEIPEVVDLVVPPAVSEQIVEEAHRLGLSRIWMQPGAESEMAITYCREHDMQVVSGACATVHKRRWN